MAEPRWTYEAGRMKVYCTCGALVDFEYKAGEGGECACGISFKLEEKLRPVIYMVTTYPARQAS